MSTPEPEPHALHLLNSLIIPNILQLPDKTPYPLHLQRVLSFPRAHQILNEAKPLSESAVSSLDISPLHPSTYKDGLILEARISIEDDAPQSYIHYIPTGSLGGGVCGSVFALEAISLRKQGTKNHDQELENPSSDALPALCIKIARRGYARTLAREAWFYEQIDKAGYTDIIVPRCYGIFRSTIPLSTSLFDTTISDTCPPDSTDPIGAPWGIDHFKDGGLWSAPLADDPFAQKADETHPYDFGEEPNEALGDVRRKDPDNIYGVDDRFKSYTHSPWALSTERRAYPTVTVLLMEKLGESLTCQKYKEDKHDIHAMFEDLTFTSIIHEDIRFANILRAPPTSQVLCPRHQCLHRWRLIDLGYSKVYFDSVAEVVEARPAVLDLLMHHAEVCFCDDPVLAIKTFFSRRAD